MSCNGNDDSDDDDDDDDDDDTCHHVQEELAPRAPWKAGQGKARLRPHCGASCSRTATGSAPRCVKKKGFLHTERRIS
jgi:hypothetical protein